MSSWVFREMIFPVLPIMQIADRPKKNYLYKNHINIFSETIDLNETKLYCQCLVNMQIWLKYFNKPSMKLYKAKPNFPGMALDLVFTTFTFASCSITLHPRWLP